MQTLTGCGSNHAFQHTGNMLQLVHATACANTHALGTTTGGTGLKQHPGLHFILALTALLLKLIIQLSRVHSGRVFRMRREARLRIRSPGVGVAGVTQV